MILFKNELLHHLLPKWGPVSPAPTAFRLNFYMSRQVLSKAVSHAKNPQDSWPPPQITVDGSGEASKLRAGSQVASHRPAVPGTGLATKYMLVTKLHHIFNLCIFRIESDLPKETEFEHYTWSDHLISTALTVATKPQHLHTRCSPPMENNTAQC